MTDQVVTIGEDVHVFRRSGLKEFEHFLRPRWSKSARLEVRVNGPMTEDELKTWITKHTAEDPITQEEKLAAMVEINEALNLDPLHIFKEKKP